MMQHQEISSGLAKELSTADSVYNFLHQQPLWVWIAAAVVICAIIVHRGTRRLRMS